MSAAAERWLSWDTVRLAFFVPAGWRVQCSPEVVAVSSPSSPRRLEARVLAQGPLPLPEWSASVASVLRQFGRDGTVVHAAEDGTALLRAQREPNVSYDIKMVPVAVAGRQLAVVMFRPGETPFDALDERWLQLFLAPKAPARPCATHAWLERTGECPDCGRAVCSACAPIEGECCLDCGEKKL